MFRCVFARLGHGLVKRPRGISNHCFAEPLWSKSSGFGSVVVMTWESEFMGFCSSQTRKYQKVRCTVLPAGSLG